METKTLLILIFIELSFICCIAIAGFIIKWIQLKKEGKI